MYAIIKTGGKQYKVQAGDVLQVEKLNNDLGSEVTLAEVLMVGGNSPIVGSPTVKDAKVTAVVTKQARTRKVFVFKKKRRQSYRRFGTHKQSFTELFITAITLPNGEVFKTDETPVVKDMAALRKERVENKVADSRARAEASIGSNKATKKTVTKTAKAAKTVKKTATKKATAKKAVAKKAPAKKKATAKKAATKK